MRTAMLMSLAITMALAGRVGALELVKDGQAVATIVVCEPASDSAKAAAEFLQWAWEQSSGAKLAIVAESDAPAEGPLICVGATALSRQAGIAPAGAGPEQYRIACDGKRLFLVGDDAPRKVYTPQGTLRAALDLLRHVYGVRYLAPSGAGIHIPSTRTISVPDDLSMTASPATFDYVAGRFPHFDRERNYWSKANGFHHMGIYLCGGHTWAPATGAEFLKAHPELWAQINGKRDAGDLHNPMLCTSHPLFAQRLTQWIGERFDEGYELVELGQSDGFAACQCARCNETFGDYKSPEGRGKRCLVPHREIALRLGESHPGKRVMITSYDITLRPPADFSGMPKNVMMELAPYTPEVLAGWQGKAEAFNAYLYMWGEYNAVGMGPMSRDVAMVAGALRDLHKANVRGLYYCGGDYNWGLLGPQYYVAATLQMDVDADVDKVLGEYCGGLYGKAGGTMRQLFHSVYERAVGFVTLTEMIPQGHLYETPEVVYTFVFPPEILRGWQALLDKAKGEAQGDERALSWLRTTQISLDHLRHLSNAFHAYRVYKMDPGPLTWEVLAKHVNARKEFNRHVTDLAAKEPQFIRNYFPSYGRFVHYLETNGTSRGRLREPFNLDLSQLEGAEPQL